MTKLECWADVMGVAAVTLAVFIAGFGSAVFLMKYVPDARCSPAVERRI